MKLRLPHSGPMRLAVTISSSKPSVLKVTGNDKTVANTVFFDRLVGSGVNPMTGQTTLYFNFPFPFGRLGITAKDTAGNAIVKIERIKQEPLHSKRLDVPPATRSFIGFAKWFAFTCGNLPVDTYTSKDGQFQIRLLDVISDYETGKVVPTPARVNHVTGVIEVCKKDFLPMTVVNRFFILMHEHTHFINNTTDEIECDMLAAKLTLDMGFDRLETLNSTMKLFLFNTDLPLLQQQEQERRVAMVKDFVERYQAS